MRPNDSTIPKNHPRYQSLKTREKLVRLTEKKVVASAGLIAHGRGEAFDYLLGERTHESALRAIEAAAAALLTSKHPVISVNGNTAALCPNEIIELASIVNAKIEVNLFHRSPERESAIKRLLEEHRAKEILGVGPRASAKIPELCSERRRVDPDGIYQADTVLIPLEDGDRAEALRRLGKTVIAIDLNPLSRTARAATITIVDNVTRAMPRLISEAKRLKSQSREELADMVDGFDNRRNLRSSISSICEHLEAVAEGILK